ncbi:MAG: helix-turn-helix domain-containing protein [Lentisphaeria bacterium]|nr:helix-turn-helix domain-containing protein [Lentisphaeria bacterium]
MLRKDFAAKLREIRKKSGVRQKEIAARLGLSCASISQFMNGVSLPKMDQLKTMLEVMRTPADEAGKMRFMLMLARSGAPGPDPAADVTQERWPLSAGGEFPGIGALPGWGDLNTPDIAFASPGRHEGGGVPLLVLEDMREYSPEVPLAVYARERMRETVIRDFGALGPPVIVQTTGERLNIPFGHLVRLALTDTLPEDYTSLRLCRFADDSYRLLPPEEPLDRKWREFLPPPADGAERCWQLPVLEMTLTPVCRTGAEQDQG